MNRLTQIHIPTRKLMRIFPRRTKATPLDDMARSPKDKLLPFPRYVGYVDEADEIHISVTFTQDIPKAEMLAEQWKHVAPVFVNGKAYGHDGLDFVPGKYIKPGYTFTSRGCPRRCWFCSVWKTRGSATPIPITDGWNILDDNLLACPEDHVRAVFAMLKRQGRQIEFTGGLEALALQDYQVGLLADMRPRPNCFFAYDPGDPFETLQSAAARMIAAGFTSCSHRLRTYVLIGYPKDTFALATQRLEQMISIGFTPHAMLWQPETPAAEKWRPAPEWGKFQRMWARPAIIHASRHGVAAA